MRSAGKSQRSIGGQSVVNQWELRSEWLKFKEQPCPDCMPTSDWFSLSSCSMTTPDIGVISESAHHPTQGLPV
ncbi:hypothetical protein SynBIOSU31_01882 [Synechococcus sp. BIOS-U3-1]|nr:hypothetical protein SynBIOSU31_01882 [Synechococcus sp. BIOS-U3-1]